MDLLARGATQLQLTPTGEAMLARSVELLSRHEAVVREIRRLGRQHPTSVTIAADDGFAGLLLATAIREYRELAPDAEVRIRSAPYGAGRLSCWPTVVPTSRSWECSPWRIRACVR